jgi:hypothetical protein
VRKLLDRDESAITHPDVFLHVHQRRQEWLDPFLKGRAIKGRFLTGKTVYVPTAQDGFHRWLPRQQRALLHLLLPVAKDETRGTWERVSILRLLPRLDVVDAAVLLPFTKGTDIPTSEAALAALAWLDRPESALGPLLEHLDSDRARVAIYAVPRVARRVPSETVGRAMEALLSRERLKVTVHKEAVRLLAALRSERSLALLRREADRPDLHRDVRIAVGHAARQLLDREEAWALLDALAASPDAYVARSLLDQPRFGVAPEARPRYLGLLLKVARHPDLEVRRYAFRVLPEWSAGEEDRIAQLASERVRDLGRGAEWREAAQALVRVVSDGRAVEHLVATAAALVEPVPDSMNATPERDLPSRQRLMSLCHTLLELPRPVRVRNKGLLLEVARVIGAEPTLWPCSARLRLTTVEWKDTNAAAGIVARLSSETQDEPLFAVDLASEVRAQLEAAAAEWMPEGLLEAVDWLFNEAPLVAVPFVAAAGARMGWTEEAARRLRALREHPKLAVRTAARSLFTAAE